MAQQPATAQQRKSYLLGVIFVIAFFLLHLGAKEARKHLGDEVASKTGKDEFGDCLDFGFGSLTCAVKQGSKLFTNNIRASIVERSKQNAFHAALQSAISEGLATPEATRKAQSIADLAGKVKSKQARRIFGPLFAAAWDSLEVLYYGGTITEVSMRATGTLCGTWWGGVVGENKLGRVGYLIGTQIGSWAGSKLALMCYDIAKAVQLVTLEVQEFFTGTDANEPDKNSKDETTRDEYDCENTQSDQEFTGKSGSGLSDSYKEETPRNDEVASERSGGWFWNSEEERPPTDDL